MFDVVRFWLDKGVDGFRADAVPYLFEEEGTDGENLPATHAFLAELRAYVDAHWPGRVIIAEANQWPRDVVEYFGTEEDPECHMCFHFPVMPRLFYALREGSARHIIDIMADTPDIPAGAQWGTFLRNHDELTLEMVSGEDRAAMLGWYAPDSRMRANIGIRRRLAPLLDNSRSELELIHALLLSLPGSPFLYYGDEIAMGDNIWLEDRDAVRTPMQWTPDRNAGFSDITDPGKLYLPVIQSLVYHYATTNVEAEMAHSGSFLHFVRWMLAVRKEHGAFGMGAYRNIGADSERVLASTLTYDGAEHGEEAECHAETLLCVFNLTAQPVTATLELGGLARRTSRDLFGGHEFPAISDDGELTVTLGAHGYYWLKVRPLTPEGEPMTTTTALPAIEAAAGSEIGAEQL